MVVEQLVVHIPEFSLLARALRRMRRVARILVAGKREVAKSPPNLAGVDQLFLDGRHLDRRKIRAEGAFEIGVLGDLDHRIADAEGISAESIIDDGRRRTRRCLRCATTWPQQHEQCDTQRDGENGQHHVEAVHASGSSLLPELRQGSSSSGSSIVRSPIASSTMRRLSATSGVSYVMRTS